MKRILGGIALLALLTACGDSNTDGDGDAKQDSGASKPDDDEADDDEADDDEADDEPAADDDDSDDRPTADDAGGPAAPTLPPPPEPISCGDVDCPAPAFGTPCCATADDVEARAAFTEGACGVDLSAVFGGPTGCVEFDQPGEPDESCPPLEIPDVDPIPGCCTSYGFCGTADNFIGIGCTTPPSEFGELIPCGGGDGDAGSGSTVLDAGTMEPTDAGNSSEPTPDADVSMAEDAGANDASP
jgi:hypothetical protein